MLEIVLSVIAIMGIFVIVYCFIDLERKNQRRGKNRADFERVFNSLEHATSETVQQTMQDIHEGKVKGVSKAHIDAAVRAAINLGFKVE